MQLLNLQTRNQQVSRFAYQPVSMSANERKAATGYRLEDVLMRRYADLLGSVNHG